MTKPTECCKSPPYDCCKCEWRFNPVRSIPCNCCTRNPFGYCILMEKDAENKKIFGQYANDWFRPSTQSDKEGTQHVLENNLQNIESLGLGA